LVGEGLSKQKVSYALDAAFLPQKRGEDVSPVCVLEVEGKNAKK